MTKRWSIMAIVAAFALVIASPAALACGRSHETPMRGYLDGEVHWEFPGEYASGCEIVTTVTESTGYLTSMGRVHGLWTHCPEEPGYVNDGRVILTNRRGHELHGYYEYDDTDDMVVTITIDGGTGRFAHASGTLTATLGLEPQFIPGCDDPESFDCLDVGMPGQPGVPWPWWASMRGTVAR